MSEYFTSVFLFDQNFKLYFQSPHLSLEKTETYFNSLHLGKSS